jgi:hypothetical protein
MRLSPAEATNLSIRLPRLANGGWQNRGDTDSCHEDAADEDHQPTDAAEAVSAALESIDGASDESLPRVRAHRQFHP